MALNSSPALAPDHFVPFATCCPLSAVAGSATALGMATGATKIKRDILQTAPLYHSARTISHSKPSTARKSPSLKKVHFLRGCQVFARVIQLMNLFASVANYTDFPLGPRLACSGYLDQNLDIYIYI